MRENPSVNAIGSQHHAAMKRKPPVHKQKKNIDMYNPNDGGLPQVMSNGEIRHGQQRNMAYVNISSDGAKPVGPIGIKRAEKELIMRRYK